ncbi:hypothetical protein OAH36_00370 [Verrucomicrobia bacterium]|nr:hypothetical protein [Verrucomicrobiota bacterium]
MRWNKGLLIVDFGFLNFENRQSSIKDDDDRYQLSNENVEEPKYRFFDVCNEMPMSVISSLALPYARLI